MQSNAQISEFFMHKNSLFVLFQKIAIQDDADDETDHQQIQPEQKENEKDCRPVQLFHGTEIDVHGESEGRDPAEEQGEKAAPHRIFYADPIGTDVQVEQEQKPEHKNAEQGIDGHLRDKGRKQAGQKGIPQQKKSDSRQKKDHYDKDEHDGGKADEPPALFAGTVVDDLPAAAHMIKEICGRVQRCGQQDNGRTRRGVLCGIAKVQQNALELDKDLQFEQLGVIDVQFAENEGQPEQKRYDGHDEKKSHRTRERRVFF